MDQDGKPAAAAHLICSLEGVGLAEADKVALVTGAGRGIGRGTALALARSGFDLVAGYRRNREAALSLVREAAEVRSGARVLCCQADISKSEDRRRLVDFALERFGRLDVLVNNAGAAPEKRADILEAEEASFDLMIAVNLKGPDFLTRLAANAMLRLIERGAQPGGTIVTISSISAFTASPNRGDYCVAKAGLSMMTKLFAARLARRKIRVYEVQPGIIATDMTSAVKDKYDRMIADGLFPIARWGRPEDVGKAVCALASGALPYSTGEVLRVDGGFHIRTL